MNPFLKQTAQYLSSTFNNDLENICIVLPNRRAGLFLRKYLAGEVGKATWAPSVLSIEDFITEISGLHEVDQVYLLFELYEVHREIDGEKAQTFDEFISWAQQLISDFNEIDRYLADPGELFSTLTEARAISIWNLDGEPLTEFEREYLRFYQSLNLYYQRLSARLLAKNQAWQGLIFRNVAENIEQIKDNLPWKHVVFAGFNALTRAEEIIIGTMRTSGLATLLWDADRYYLNDEKQEAGEFLRNWFRKWPVKEARWISDDFAIGSKQISIIGAPDPVGQVKYCGKLLRELALQGKANETTAVVLLDVALLIPLLNSIPDEVKELNITAGLPLKQTPLAGLFDAVFNMHIHSSRFARLSAGKNQKYYYKDVLKMIQHPYIQLMAEGLMKGNCQALIEVTDRIRRGVQSFISYQDIAGDQAGLFGIDLTFLQPTFIHWNTPSDALVCFKSLIENLRTSIQRQSPIEHEYLFAFSGIFHQLTNILRAFPGNIKIPVFYELFKQITGSATLPFYGEPLKGVQLMGMLETRTLDFENLIILSCNEDLLPAGKINSSFIPFDIKRSFGLPTYRQKDSVYAYHFYRLIQRAKNISILYNTEPDQLGGGDRSRFLRQILHELPAYNPEIYITEAVLTTPVIKGGSTRTIEIPKSEDVPAALEAKARKGFSASSLNLYRNCQLKFYYSEIAGIKEPEEITDTIEPNILGSAVHEALNELYKTLQNKELSADLLRSLLAGSEQATLRAFEKKYKGADVMFGKNLLLINVAKLLVNKFIHFDIQEEEELARSSKKRTVSFLEYHIETSIAIPYTADQLTINVKGFLDRVDNVDGWWKIIDYKTGTTDEKNIKIKEWDELIGNPDLNIGFQLLMYGFLLNARYQGEFSASAGIISLRKLNSGFKAVSIPSEENGKFTTLLTPDSANRFQTILKTILTDIYDLSKSFKQTENPKICENCPYLNLCGR
ncbi:MAG: PD-(D/E)XK nuclease family protein [Bacteroidota bacterium]